MESETTGLLSGHDARQQALSSRKRQITFALCILCCLAEGSVTLISLYTPTLLSMGYTTPQLNAIVIATELGMYLPAPILGYIGDRHGHSKLAVLSGALLCGAYCLAAYSLYAQWSYQVLALAFTLIGVGSTSYYIFSFVTCAHLYPDRSGLAISAPVASFGLSSLWMSQAVPWVFGSKVVDRIVARIDSLPSMLNIQSLFIFFATFYLVFCTIGYGAVQLAGGDDEPKDYVATRSKTTPNQLVHFMLKKETWILMATFILVSGPLEIYLNNIGAIMSATPTHQTPSSHVAAFSALSTLARLTVGAFSDYIRPRVSTATVVAAILAATGIVHILLACGLFSTPAFFYLVSAMNGFSYGAMFTLYPTMVALIWGVEGFGSHWGLFILSPALGSVFYGIVFGKVYQAHSDPLGICLGNQCYDLTFYLSGSGICLAALLVLALWKYSWIKEGVSL